MFTKRIAMLALFAGALIGLYGCATTPDQPPASLQTATSPAWSLTAPQDEMTVSVSPARRTLQIAGSSGAIIGIGVDAVVNAKHRETIREALGDYAPGDVFEQALAERLEAAMGDSLTRVTPLGNMAGFQSRREAQEAREAGLAKRGHDFILDLKMTYGIFGPAGTLVTKLAGVLSALPKGNRIWDATIVVHTEPILACDKLADPTKQLAPNFSAPRLTVEGDAVKQWTRDGGEALRTEFERGVDGVVSALLCSLGLADEAQGHFYLAKNYMNRKKHLEAEEHFARAIELDPAFHEAVNARAVNIAHNGQVDDAIRLDEQLIAEAPDNGPAHFNLAWWYAIDKEDPAKARPLYAKALELGVPAHPKLDKVLGQN